MHGVKTRACTRSSAAAGTNCHREGMASDLGAKWVIFTLLGERPLLPKFPHVFKVDSKGHQLSSRHCPLRWFLAKRSIYCFRGCEVGESKNTQSIHSSVLREYCMHHPGRKWRNTMGSQGLLWFVQGPSERSVLEENSTRRWERVQQPVSVERDVRESYVQVSGAVTHSQLQRQKKTIWAVYLGKMCFICNR